VRGEPQAALAELERLLGQAPGCGLFLSLRGAARLDIGDYAAAMADFTAALEQDPDQPRLWLSLGHALRTVGRQAESVEAYRRSLALAPTLGEAYWSLANLKTFRFTDSDVETLQAQLSDGRLADDDRLHCHFALGKALEDAAEWAASFEHYRAGNAIRRRQLPYDAAETSDRIGRATALFDESFFADRGGAGSPDADPIFIVGLPRSGSTLIEQILASHSQVEGTMELPDLTAMAKRLGGRLKRGDISKYPEALGALTRDELTALGEEYLARTRIQRKTDRPRFIDKMPNNFLHVGMIQLILPNAKIIDARRQPMAACFSCFKQHFARGQAFSYDLADLANYYADYVALMAHFDRTLRGRIHRVQYEAMVGDTETEIRRLLDYCGLDFEPGCLSFWQTDRSVRTASAEQVRRPIFGEAVEHWRHFEPWLGPLKQALDARNPVTN
jgi:tetratricopeptide (TPR) repeat protein